MIDQQALAKYRETQVMTASPEKLVVLTYAALNRFVEGAISAHQAKDWESFHEQMLRAQDAVNELQIALDLEQGGEIAANLWTLYNYFRQQLIQANIRRNISLVEEIQPMIKSLQEAWAEICHA